VALRIAMLGQYPIDESHIVGGVEAVMVPLLRGLVRFTDLDLHVLTCQSGVNDRLGQTAFGQPLHVLKRYRLGRITFHRRDVVHMQHTLQRLAPDLVHAQGMGIYAAAAVASPYPHIVTAHGIFFREAELATEIALRFRGFLDSILEQYCLTRVKNLISISPYVEDELVTRRGFLGQVYRIENPVDDRFFSVQGQEEQGTVLYAGAVVPRKNLLDLLRAFVIVRERMPRVCLRVAGEIESAPGYVATCRRFIEEQHLTPAVSFLGSLSAEEMANEYAHCSLLALPSRQETAPVAIAEAMAAGRPVVATAMCGVPYMVEEGVSGLLVELGDVSALADALLRVLSDAPLRQRMGTRGREIAEARFRADIVAAQTRQVYLRLQSLKAPPQRGPSPPRCERDAKQLARDGRRRQPDMESRTRMERSPPAGAGRTPEAASQRGPTGSPSKGTFRALLKKLFTARWDTIIRGWYDYNVLRHLRPLSPRQLQVNVTYRCNARCTMCNIWQMPEREEMSLEDFSRMLDDPLFGTIERLTLAGGEPSLRRDLLPLTRLFVQKMPRLNSVTLITNGLAVERILTDSRAMVELCAQRGIHFNASVSLDGVGQVHDEMRNVPGAFARVERCLMGLKQLQTDAWRHEYSQPFWLGASCVITRKNLYGLRELQDWCAERGVDLGFQLVGFHETYVSNVERRGELDFDQADREYLFSFLRELAGLRAPPNFISYYWHDMLKMYRDGRSRQTPCPFAVDSFVLDCYGDLYYCLSERKIGNCACRHEYSLTPQPPPLRYGDAPQQGKSVTPAPGGTSTAGDKRASAGPCSAVYYAPENLAFREQMTRSVCLQCNSGCFVNVGIKKDLKKYLWFLATGR